METAQISLIRLKEIARKLPQNHPFRLVMLAEDDYIGGSEYLAKLKTWLRLLQEEAK
jgi:hypothetical protein